MLIFLGFAVVAQSAQSLRELLIICRDQAAITGCTQVLPRIKAEAACRTHGSARPAAIGSSMRLRRVAIPRSGAMSADCMVRWSGVTALVRDVMAGSTFSGSTL